MDRREQLLEELAKIDLMIEMESAKTNYASYVKYTHRYDKEFKMAKFQEYICDCVDKLLNDELINPEGKPYEGICLSQPPQTGKAMEDSTPVLTTKGWKLHGNLKVGDYVYGVDGKPKKVLATQESYLHECMELTLDTGESFICAKEHEWVIESARGRKINGKHVGREVEILETQNIFNGYHAKSPAIRVTESLQNKDIELPIEPYLLGLWLGDGSSDQPSITANKEECAELEKTLTDKGHIVKVGGNSGGHNLLSVGVTDGKKGSNYFRNSLKECNLLHNKHIPEIYFIASHRQRLELLKGMMDSDGCVCKRGRCEYCGINKRLVQDFEVLARTLGFKTSFKIGDAKLNGIKISDKYRVSFQSSKEQEIFNLKRKQERVNNKQTSDRLDKKRFFITQISSCGIHSVKCITVEDGVYLVGRGLVPTHNSLCITETLPSYYLGRFPYNHVIEISYGEDLAVRFGRRNKQKIEEFGRALFGMELSKHSASALEFEINKTNGGMISRGIGGQITGSPADFILIDDPYKNRQEADSPSYKKFVTDEWLNTIQTRASAKCKYIVVHTRWNEDDLIGTLLEQEPDKWFEISFPAIAEKDELETSGRMLGDALLPEAGKDLEWLINKRKSYEKDPTEGGIRAWNALYQQRPSSLEGNMIKREYWQRFDLTLDMQKQGFFPVKIQSWDCALKDTSDPVAGQVWGKRGSNCYLVDHKGGRMDIVKTMDGIVAWDKKHPDATAKLIEDKANGPAAIRMLRNKVQGLIPVNPGTKSKAERVNVVLPLLMAGNVWVPKRIEVEPGVFKHCEWAEEIIEQCAAFKPDKKVQRDDEVDSMSMALGWLMWREADLPIEKKADDFNLYRNDEEDYTYGEISQSYIDYGVNI